MAKPPLPPAALAEQFGPHLAYEPPGGWRDESTQPIDRMVKTLDAARKYYAEWFHPYPWRDLKLTEFPGLATYAQGFPGNITFSEAIGFLTKDAGDDEADVVRGLGAEGIPFSIDTTKPAVARFALEVAAAGGNVVDVDHVREGVDLSVRETGIQLVVETRGRAHADTLLAALREHGYETRVLG